MLPMIVATAEDQPVLCPDDLRPDGEARVRQAVGHGRGMQRTVPDIGHIARKQCPSLSPIGAVIVQHLAGTLGLGSTCLVPPRRIVFNAIGRVGDHQQGADIAQQTPDHISTGAVAADQAVRPQLPEIARHRYRRDRRLGNVILTLDRAAFHLIRVSQQGVQVLVGDPQQRQIEILGQEPRDFIAQHRLVPFAQFRQLVVRDPIGPTFGLVEMAEPDDRHVLQSQHCGGQHPTVARDQLAIVSHHAGHGPAKLGHAGSDLRHLIVAVHLGIAGIGA